MKKVVMDLKYMYTIFKQHKTKNLDNRLFHYTGWPTES